MTAKTDNVLLVALKRGIAPHTSPLECPDLTGPRSLFGEGMKTPRPLCTWAEEVDPEGLGLKIGCVHARNVILWKGPPAVLSAHAPEEGELSVPATTFIAGNCTSTFDAAWQLAQDGLLPEWGSVLAASQSSGRGQLRREWFSPRGNLYATFRLPDDANLRGDAASVVVGWLLAKAFARLGFPLFLKWPNDLLTREGKKAGGILLEERGGTLLAGVGINLAEAPPAARMRAEHATPAAVLFKEEEKAGDAPLAPFFLWRSLVGALIQEYVLSVAGKSNAAVVAGVNDVLSWKGRTVTVSEGDGSLVSGRLEGIGEHGGVLLRRSSGEVRELCSGSLSLG